MRNIIGRLHAPTAGRKHLASRLERDMSKRAFDFDFWIALVLIAAFAALCGCAVWMYLTRW